MQRSSKATSGCRVISNHARFRSPRLSCITHTSYWYRLCYSERHVYIRSFFSLNGMKCLPSPKLVESLPEPFLSDSSVHGMVHDLQILQHKLDQLQSAMISRINHGLSKSTGQLSNDLGYKPNIPLQEIRELYNKLKDVPEAIVASEFSHLSNVRPPQTKQDSLSLPLADQLVKIPFNLTPQVTLSRVCTAIVNTNYQLNPNDFVMLAKIFYKCNIKSAVFRVVKGFSDSGFHHDLDSVMALLQMAVKESDVELLKFTYSTFSSSNPNINIEDFVISALGDELLVSEWLEKLAVQSSNLRGTHSAEEKRKLTGKLNRAQSIAKFLDILQGDNLAEGVQAWKRLVRLLKHNPKRKYIQEALLHGSKLIERALDGNTERPDKNFRQISVKDFKTFLLSVTFLAAQNGIFLAPSEGIFDGYANKESVSLALELRTIMAVRAVFATHKLLVEEVPRRYRVLSLFPKSTTNMDDVRERLQSKLESISLSTAELRHVLSDMALSSELEFYLPLVEQDCFKFIQPTLGSPLQYLTMLSRAHTLRLSSSFVRHMVLAVWLPNTHIYKMFSDRSNYSRMLAILEEKRTEIPAKQLSVENDALILQQLELMETKSISDAREVGSLETYIEPDSQQAVVVELAVARFIRDITVMDTLKYALETCIKIVKNMNNTYLSDTDAEHRRIMIESELCPLLDKKALGSLSVDCGHLAKLSWSKLLSMRTFVMRKYVVQSSDSNMESLQETIGKTVAPRYTVGNTGKLNLDLFNATRSNRGNEKLSKICNILLSSRIAPNPNSFAIILQEFTRMGYIAGAKRLIKCFHESKLPVTRRWALAIIDLSRKAPIPSLLYSMSRRVLNTPELGKSAIITSRISDGLLEFHHSEKVPRHLHWFLHTSQGKRLSFNNLIVQLKLAWAKRDQGDEGFLLAWQAWNEIVHQERRLKIVISETAIFYAARVAMYFTPVEAIRDAKKDPLRNPPIPDRLLDGEEMSSIAVYKAQFLLSVISHAARSGIPLDGFAMLNEKTDQQHPISFKMLTHRSQQWRYYNALRLRMITRIRAIAWQATKAGRLEMHVPVRYFNWLFSPNKWEKITIKKSLHIKQIGFAKELHSRVMRLISRGIVNNKRRKESDYDDEDDGDDIDFYLSLVDRGCFRYFHRNIRRYRSALKEISNGISQTLSDPFIEAIFNEISLQEPTRSNILEKYHKAMRKDGDVFQISKFNINMIDDYDAVFIGHDNTTTSIDDEDDYYYYYPREVPEDCNNYLTHV